MIFIPNNIFPERKTKQPSKEELLAYQDRILFLITMNVRQADY